MSALVVGVKVNERTPDRQVPIVMPRAVMSSATSARIGRLYHGLDLSAPSLQVSGVVRTRCSSSIQATLGAPNRLARQGGS